MEEYLKRYHLLVAMSGLDVFPLSREELNPNNDVDEYLAEFVVHNGLILGSSGRIVQIRSMRLQCKFAGVSVREALTDPKNDDLRRLIAESVAPEHLSFRRLMVGLNEGKMER